MDWLAIGAHPIVAEPARLAVGRRRRAQEPDSPSSTTFSR